MYTILCENITKEYQIFDKPLDKLLNLFFKESYGRTFKAVRDINFKAHKGEVIGFAGINGSGKSTLANIIAGITPETKGMLKIEGEVSLIAVSAGLNNELSGRNNIKMKCLMMGFTSKEIKVLEPQIIKFAEIDEFIDQPVKFYSSGMKSRLGFSIAITVNPDILIIDEALSVGDNAFAEKCLKKMFEFKEQGKSMIFVSHSLTQMRKFCDRVLWMEFGQVKKIGKANEVLDEYEIFLQQWNDLSTKQRNYYREKAKLYDIKNENYPKLPQTMKFVEKQFSRIGFIKHGSKIFYLNPKKNNAFLESIAYENTAFYIEKIAKYNNQSYFCLFTNKGKKIGWVREEDVESYPYSLNRKIAKKLKILGTGGLYFNPLGLDADEVFEKGYLKQYLNENVIAKKSLLVNEVMWYQIEIEQRYLWIEENNVEEV